MTTTEVDWLVRAREVAAQLAVDAVQRDRESKTPDAEIQLLKENGLVTCSARSSTVAADRPGRPPTG